MGYLLIDLGFHEWRKVKPQFLCLIVSHRPQFHEPRGNHFHGRDDLTYDDVRTAADR